MSKKLAVRISDELNEDLLAVAAAHGMNTSEFVTKSIEDAIFERVNLPVRLEKIEDDLKEILWNISLLSNYQMEMSKLLFTRLPRGGAVMDEQARQRYFQSVEDVQKLASRSVAGVMEMKDIWGLEEGSEGENK